MPSKFGGIPVEQTSGSRFGGIPVAAPPAAPAAPARVPTQTEVLRRSGVLPEWLTIPAASVENALRAARQGATFGFSDEAVGARDAVLSALTGGDESPATVYRQSRDLERARLRQFQQDSPGPSLSAGIGGGLLTGVGGSRTVAAESPTLLRSVAGAVPKGVAVGAVAGLGVGEGDAGQQAASAGRGALLGGLVAPAITVAAPVVAAGARGVKAAYNMLTGGARTAPRVPPATPAPSAAPTVTRLTEPAPTRTAPRPAVEHSSDRALALVGDTVRRSGVRAADIEEQLVRAEELGVKPEMLADFLGDQGARRLYSTRTLGGPASAEAVERLATRGEGTAARVSEDVQRATGQRGQSLTQLEASIENRRKIGNELYQQAYRHGAITNPDTLALIQNPRVAGILKNAADRRAQVADLRGEAYQPLFRESEQGPILARVPTVEDLHLLKTSLDDDIRQAYQAGEGQLGNALRDFKNRIVRSLEDEVPAYRMARETYKGDIEVEEAIAAGRADILRKPVDELRRDFAALSGAEKDAYRSGAIDTILARKVDPKVDSADFARSLWGNADSRNRLQLLVKNEEELARLSRQFEREQRIARTNRAVLGGSPTAMRSADIEDQVAGTLADVATQGPQGAFVSTMGRLIRRAGGVTESVADDVARMLTAESPETIRAVLRSLQERDQLRVMQAVRRNQAARGAAATTAQQTNGSP